MTSQLAAIYELQNHINELWYNLVFFNYKVHLLYVYIQDRDYCRALFTQPSYAAYIAEAIRRRLISRRYKSQLGALRNEAIDVMFDINMANIQLKNMLKEFTNDPVELPRPQTEPGPLHLSLVRMRRARASGEPRELGSSLGQPLTEIETVVNNSFERMEDKMEFMFELSSELDYKLLFEIPDHLSFGRVE